MEDNNIKKRVVIIILILIIFLLLYLLIHYFGTIEHHGPDVPTGNVDIFDIDCSCCKSNTKQVSKEDKKANSINKNKTENNNRTYYSNTHESGNNNSNYSPNQNESENNSSSEEENNFDFMVYDDYKVWDTKELRIFSNPAFKYKNIIAPGSKNSYDFVIRNKNNFDVVVDISFTEQNDKNINMKYKLRNIDNYLIGSTNNYDHIDGKKITDITIGANSEKSYILDWKWIDNYNDTELGIDAPTNYKLLINIGAKQR